MPTPMTSTSFLRPSLPAVTAAVFVALMSGCAVTRVDPPAPYGHEKKSGLSWPSCRTVSCNFAVPSGVFGG